MRADHCQSFVKFESMGFSLRPLDYPPLMPAQAGIQLIVAVWVFSRGRADANPFWWNCSTEMVARLRRLITSPKSSGRRLQSQRVRAEGLERLRCVPCGELRCAAALRIAQCANTLQVA